MFWAKMKAHRLLSPFLYALAASALMAILLFAVNAQRSFVSDQSSKTSIDNVESRLRGWLDSFGLTVQKRNDTTATEFFRYGIVMTNGDRIDITRLRERDRYIVLYSHIVFPQSEWSKFTPAQLQQVSGAISLELARARVGYTSTKPHSDWLLEKRIPISPTLSEGELIAAIDGMDSAMVSVQAIAAMTLQGAKIR